ncbi:Hsp70 family protein [Ideonella sp. A 288]|uniref:Hsp70 family protein n=1 Tax=Ideonella sp. A 288 TaxID=1962181 RepID=UPI0038558AB3
MVAFAPVKAGASRQSIRLFDIDQLVAAGEVAARPLLPSVRYHPAAGELAAGDTTLPWPPATTDDGAVIGMLARQLGAQVPGRLVTSAKSWLSHAAVDRLADILPWGAPADVPKVSPVAASASTLAHVRAAWNHHHPAQPLEQQELVLTVPASFDDAARTLTLQAARDAGLPTLRLLEEPQAALTDWLFRHRKTLREDLADTRLVLVCDVGGGTTDLSLVRVDLQDDEPRLERIAVGRHLMLGGDNMDLALAHLAETRLGQAEARPGQAQPRLGAGQLAQLVERCRAVKERLLAADAPASASVTLLGGGSRLVGGARSVEFTRDEVHALIVDGFFPQGAADEGPRRERASGLVSFGLPYAADAAVTRHVSAFLAQHAGAGWPDAVLLNGGVFRAHAIATRLQATLSGWSGRPLRLLHNDDPDVAVARGAVAHALARRGLAPRITGGSPRSYFLQLDDGAGGLAKPGVCLLPQGSEAGHELRLEGRRFALRVGEPVRFHLAATTADGAGHATPAAGDLVDLADRDAQALPPLATVVRADVRADVPGEGRREIPVQLAAMLTEVGTLEVHCLAADDPAQRWQLEFQLRGEPTAGAAATAGLPPRFDEAVACIERVFGARLRDADPKAVKQLRPQLEALLGHRERWPTALLRPLFDALWQRHRGRRRSADHERLWLSLAGWCLRPGFGDALDGWRIEQLWPLFEQGVQHGHEAQVNSEWWTLWRRVAGGLDEAAQSRLLEDFAFNLRGAEAGLGERPARLVKGGWDEMLRLGASLERVPAEHKVEIGDWLLQRLRPAAAGTGPRPVRDPWTLWALGRLGARVPLYGSAHGVVPIETAQAWLDVLLALDWKQADGAAAAAANLARRSGDRARDLPPEVSERVVGRLQSHGVPAAWIDRVREVVALDEAAERSLFGDALPPGLKLLH